jgi:FdhD protein
LFEETLRRFHHPYPPDEAGHGDPTTPVDRISWRNWRMSGESRPVDGDVVVEEPLEIRLNGQPVAVVMRTPGLEKELAAGFCLGEGLIADPLDVALVRHCGRLASSQETESDPLDVSYNRVDVTLMPDAPASLDQGGVVPLIRSGCGRTETSALLQDLIPVQSQLTVPLETLFHLPAQMTRQQSAYRAAGGVHAAAVFDTSGRAVVVCEDIGRHNAVDKAMGYCLLRGISLRDKLLASTGRASYDMVAKAVRLGVPIIASLSSPTSLAIKLAEALNCTLLGYLRGKTLNVYTHDWRIVCAGTGSKEDQ